ncbi:hypothetical protein [Ferruginibacter sp. SUN106]|uniref:hypothetical protein n=1 Tax=Ferruginibacter sp. SUN106 TaxID=2978348 RepID=UPI003D361E99
MRFFILFFICFLLTVAEGSAQQQYNGKLVLLYTDTIAGTFRLDMHGSNNLMVEMISIERRKNKDRKARQKIITDTIREKYNPGIITNILIGNTWYKLRDLKNNYGDSMTKRNCFVKRIAGTDTLGLFEFVNAAGASSFYIQTQKDGAQIYNISHPYLAGDFKSFSLLRFYDCVFLREKISSKTPGYFYDESGNDTGERVTVWKNIIKGYYDNCNIVKPH